MCAERRSAPCVRSRRCFWVSSKVAPICAKGSQSGSRENALVIHYTRNDHLLRDGELVLMDAGGEYKYVFLRARKNPRANTLSTVAMLLTFVSSSRYLSL